MTNFEKVGKFMKIFGQDVKTSSGLSSEKINLLRIKLIEEELSELKNAMNEKPDEKDVSEDDKKPESLTSQSAEKAPEKDAEFSKTKDQDKA